MTKRGAADTSRPPFRVKSALAGFVGEVVDADLEEAGVGAGEVDLGRVVRRRGRHVEVAEVGVEKNGFVLAES